MPSNWLYIDTNFPSFTQKESASDKIETMQDYLFMLVEQLRYTLHNLDLSNMNKTAADGFVKQITDPIYGEIKDAEGNITQLQATAQGLSARIGNAEGNITRLGATADGLAAEIRNVKGDITSLGARADGLAAEIKNAKGDITQLGARADGLAARIGDAEGNITQLQATAKGLQASISNLDGAITNIKADVNGIRATVSTKIDATQAQSIFDQSATGFTLGATSGENGTTFKLNYNGVQVASTGSIDLCVDAVNIYGTLTAGALRGGSVSLLAGDTPVGSMDLAYTGTGQVGVGLTATYGGMKMHAAGNIFLESELGPFALIGKDNASDYPVVSLGGGYLVLSGNYTFGASPPSHAPYGTVFFIEE
jgi:predicted  nucleic acid-binding Zn-ribbon protein